jgi:hypothetical protein
MVLAMIRTGHWQYAGTVAMTVDIVGRDYDFWFESLRSADALASGDEPMQPDPQGLI